MSARRDGERLRLWVLVTAVDVARWARDVATKSDHSGGNILAVKEKGASLL